MFSLNSPSLLLLVLPLPLSLSLSLDLDLFVVVCKLCRVCKVYKLILYESVAITCSDELHTKAKRRLSLLIILLIPEAQTCVVRKLLSASSEC